MLYKMTHYSCNVCDKPAQEEEYTFPIKISAYDKVTTALGNGSIHYYNTNERDEIITDKFNLCPDCKDKIADYIRKMKEGKA